MRRIDDVLIAGGGIGGLAAALALHRAGVPVRVFEQAPALREVGAGVGLWANALRVLDRLGVGAAIREGGTPLHVAEVCSYRGERLARLDFREALPEATEPNHVVHRADLLGLLAEALPDGIVETGARCTGLRQDGDGVTAFFEDREPARGRLLVGADGLHSQVRSALWGSGPVRYSGQTCFRGIAHLSVPDSHVLREVNGPGQRGCVVALGGGRVYWWMAYNAPRDEVDDPAHRKDDLLARYAGWPYLLPEAVAFTQGPILRNDLVDRRPLARWSRGRVTLLGDAAHPMLPNLGQGACTAIEDALVLARHVATQGPTAGALQAYERERQRRTTRLVRQSWYYGLPAQWTHPVAVRLRERLTRLTPPAMLAATFRRHIGYDAGPLPGGGG